MQKLIYTYDNGGNVTNLVDTINSIQKQCFRYDWLDRLTNAFIGDATCLTTSYVGIGSYSHGYYYDTIGNITTYSINDYTYGDAAHKHAVTAAFGNSYGYDANGNQTTRTIGGVAYTFTYDYENHLTAVSGGSISASFVYDTDGNRVKGTVNGTTTVYIAGLYEYQGGATTLYYEGNALRRTGYATDNGVFYLLQDQLKSSSALINQNGTVNSRNYFYPFGGNRGGAAFSGLTTKRFTGQYHEQGLPGGEGLSYYGARWYDAQLGRFASPDSIVPGPGNPQAFNRYAYTLNNPLRYTDSTGHSVDGPGIGAGGTVVTQPYRLYLPIVSNQSQRSNARIFYLNGLGGHPLQPSADSLGEYDYLYYRLQKSFGTNNVTHVPLFTNQYQQGWSHLEMFREAYWPSKPWTDIATSTISAELDQNPLKPGDRLVLVGSSAGGTVAIEALARLKEKNIHVNQVILCGSFVRELFLTNVDSVDYIAANPPWSDQWYSLDVNPFDNVNVQQRIATKLYGHTPSGLPAQIQAQLQELGDSVIDAINGAR